MCLAFILGLNLTFSSRLACQIPIRKDMDGTTVFVGSHCIVNSRFLEINSCITFKLETCLLFSRSCILSENFPFYIEDVG